MRTLPTVGGALLCFLGAWICSPPFGRAFCECLPSLVGNQTLVALLAALRAVTVTPCDALPSSVTVTLSLLGVTVTLSLLGRAIFSLAPGPGALGSRCVGFPLAVGEVQQAEKLAFYVVVGPRNRA